MEAVSLIANLKDILRQQLNSSEWEWLEDHIQKTVDPPSARNLYLGYSLIGRKFWMMEVDRTEAGNLSALPALTGKVFQIRDLARIYLLSSVLSHNPDYFVPKVGKLIQVADTGELVTMLRFLTLLPKREAFRDMAVEALRTNIASVFDAISLDNPYPRMYFNEQQWNQMYLKAAFMQRDLSRIQGVDERSNAALTRIISDYAHERWAASREVDPLFWRPVSGHLNDTLLLDMKRLLASESIDQQMAGYLCCLRSGKPEAEELIREHPLNDTYNKRPFDWKDLQN